MKNENISFKDMFIKGAVIFNPVLVQLVGLCPAVAASTSLVNAAVLSVVLCADLIITCLLASALLKKVPRWIRVPLYLLIGIAIICPVLWIVETKTLITLSLGMKIYIPLIAVNSVTAVHCEQFSVKNSVKLAVYDAAAVGIGSSIVLILVGALRELLGASSLGGVTLELPVAFKGMLLPFGGLVILGFVAAALRAFIAEKYPAYLEESGPVVKKPENAAPKPQPAEESGEVEEVELFDEFWTSETVETPAEKEPEPQPKPELSSQEKIRWESQRDIEEFFKSLGLDSDESGVDKQ